MVKLDELGWKLLLKLPYSPDMAPSGYFLFPNLIRWLQGKRFESNDKATWENYAYFGRFDKSYYLEGIKKLESRWTSYSEVNI